MLIKQQYTKRKPLYVNKWGASQTKKINCTLNIFFPQRSFLLRHFLSHRHLFNC